MPLCRLHINRQNQFYFNLLETYFSYLLVILIDSLLNLQYKVIGIFICTLYLLQVLLTKELYLFIFEYLLERSFLMSKLS